MKTSLILLSFIASFFIRALRWLSIVQQKEYRFDRLSLFLKTAEGKGELLRIIPKKKDFSRTGLKRPKITVRILVTSFFFFAEFIFLIGLLVLKSFGLMKLSYGGLLFFISLLIGLIIYLILVPALVFLAVLPTAIISSIKIYIELVRAKMKVKKAGPIIVGVTGSYGKTSTKMVLAKVLEKKYSVFKTPKSYNTKFSVAKSINNDFKNQQVMILEYGAYKKGEIKTLASWFKPNMAVVTGLTNQHLGLFGSIDFVVAAKAELVKSLDSGSKVICNGDDPGAIEICKLGAGKDIKIIEANDKNENSLTIKSHLNKLGKLVFVWNGLQVSTNFMGMHYLEIIRMVILVAKEFGLSDDEIADAISNFIPDDKFVYSYKSESGNLIIDDGGTSNQKGFEAAIKLVSEIEAANKILISSGIVDLGMESVETHMKLAKEAKNIFSKVLYTGQSGNEEFKTVFEKDFIGDQVEIIDFLSKLTGSEMILIEGKMPGWITKYLK